MVAPIFRNVGRLIETGEVLEGRLPGVESHLIERNRHLEQAGSPLSAEISRGAPVRHGLFPARRMAAAPPGGRPPIDPARVEGETVEPSLRLSDDEVRLLNRGIRDEKDLEAFRALVIKVSPDDAGLLARGTVGLPHEWVEVRETTSTGALVGGTTELTFGRSIDRRIVESGIRVRLNRPVHLPNAGVSPDVLLHEWAHAVPLGGLHVDYQRHPIPEIPSRHSPLVDCYRAILENSYWDEALAFGAPVRFSFDLNRRTGNRLNDFLSVRDGGFFRESHVEIYQKEGFPGLYRSVQESQGYLSYKVAALYTAILYKEGATELPRWGEMIAEMKRDRRGPARFFEEKIYPRFKGRGFDIGTWLVGTYLNPTANGRIKEAALFVSNALSPQEVARFLREDFNWLVGQAGSLIYGEELPPEKAAAVLPAVTKRLPPRPRPMKVGDPLHWERSPAVLADSVEVLGRHAGILREIRNTSASRVVSDNLGPLLQFAEQADPEAGATLYSFILSSSYPPIHDRQIGLSLLRSGYFEEARPLLERGLDFDPNNLYGNEQEEVPQIIEALLECGMTDLAARYVDQSIEPLSLAIISGLSPQKMARAPEMVARIEKAVREQVAPLSPYKLGYMRFRHTNSPLLRRSLADWRQELIRKGRWADDYEELEKAYTIWLNEDLGEGVTDAERRSLGVEYGQVVDSPRGSLDARDRKELERGRLSTLGFLYLGGEDPSLREEGVALLAELLKENPYFWTPTRRFRRRNGMTITLKPHEQRPLLEVCHAAMATNIGGHPNGYGKEVPWYQNNIDHYLDLIAEALITGHGALLDPMESTWNVWVERDLVPSDSSLVEASLLFRLRAALGAGGSGLDGILGDVREAVRGEYDVRSLRAALRVMAERANFETAGFPGRWLRDFAEIAVDRTASQWKQGGQDARGGVGPFIETIQSLPISLEERDELICRLMRAAIPSAELRSDDTVSLDGVFNSYQLFQAVLGNPETPQAEGLLLSRMAEWLRGWKRGISDPRSWGLLQGLSRVFERIADDCLLSPSNRGRLEALRNDPEYRAALATLLDPWEVQEASDLRLLFYRYRLAREREEDLGPLQAELRRVISSELHQEKMDRLHTSFSLETLMENYQVGEVLKDWRQALEQGDLDSADRLYQLWGVPENAPEAELRSPLYNHFLRDPKIPLEVKRRLFLDSVRFDRGKVYRIRLHEKVVAGGEGWREALFYRLLWKDDYSLARLLTIPQGSAEGFVHSSVRGGRPFDPSDPFAFQAAVRSDDFSLNSYRLLILLASISATNHDPRISRLLFEEPGDPSPGERDQWRNGNELQFTQQDNGLWWKQPLLAEFKRRFAGATLEEGWERELFNLYRGVLLWSRPPTLKEAERMLAELLSFYREDLKIADQIRMAMFEMPKPFRGRDPVTQFWVSRFFPQLDLAERDALIRKFDEEGVTEGSALRFAMTLTGLEKLGQMIAGWPNVLPAIRNELAPLQDQVPPTDSVIIRKTIAAGLLPSARPEGDLLLKESDIQFLVDHLDLQRPIGSASIGEVYRSELPDGRPVAVKVIPPPKEKRVLKSVKKLEKAREIFGVYLDEPPNSPDYLPHARTVYRLSGILLRMIRGEFDLVQEMVNADDMRSELPAGHWIPSYLTASPKVALLELVRGRRFNEIADAEERATVVARVRGLVAQQVSGDGSVHLDLHPGNLILEDPSGRLILLDPGQAVHLDDFQRQRVLELAAHLMGGTGDVEGLAGTLEKMGQRTERYQPQTFRERLAMIAPETLGRSEGMAALLDAAEESRLRLPDYLYLLLFGASKVEGLG